LPSDNNRKKKKKKKKTQNKISRLDLIHPKLLNWITHEREMT
jgi:hypothetical protein